VTDPTPLCEDSQGGRQRTETKALTEQRGRFAFVAFPIKGDTFVAWASVRECHPKRPLSDAPSSRRQGRRGRGGVRIRK
jgi:hypothetical protein